MSRPAVGAAQAITRWSVSHQAGTTRLTTRALASRGVCPKSGEYRGADDPARCVSTEPPLAPELLSWVQDKPSTAGGRPPWKRPSAGSRSADGQVPEAIAVAEAVGVSSCPRWFPLPEDAAPPETPGLLSAQRPAAGRTREFDDIPSVVRALLVGYDEV